MTENEQKADLMKKALTIVDELAELDFSGVDSMDDAEDLIERAEKLKKHRLWKLK